jgi:2-polyprenyl-3-methyl-5-hydroxy-6-metoxy-1,4-benzoquinol methylase
MGEFSAGEDTWTERLGNLRNTVRQELIGRHLDDHVRDGASVLDMGCE